MKEFYDLHLKLIQVSRIIKILFSVTNCWHYGCFCLCTGARSVAVFPPVCLEAGQPYKIRLEFKRYDSQIETPTASVLVDSVSYYKHTKWWVPYSVRVLMLTMVAWPTLWKTKVLLSWIYSTLYAGKSSDQIMHYLPPPANPSQSCYPVPLGLW